MQHLRAGNLKDMQTLPTIQTGGLQQPGISIQQSQNNRRRQIQKESMGAMLMLLGEGAVMACCGCSPHTPHVLHECQQ